MERWWVWENNEAKGPFEAGQLDFVREDTMLCREGTEEWKTAASFSELADLVSSRTVPGSKPPPPPPPTLSQAQSVDQAVQTTTLLKEEDVKSFIGDNHAVYMRKFRKFNISGIDTFAATWHWPAFFVGFPWTLYRKLYLWALGGLLVACIPVIGLILVVLIWPICANYVYYRHARRKILEARSVQPTADISAALSRIGGTNIWLAILAPLVLLIAYIFTFA